MDKDKFISLYNSGASLREIGEYFGFSRGTAINRLNELIKDGYPLKKRGQGAQKNRLTKSQKLQAIALYKKGYPFREIGIKFGITGTGIRYFIYKIIDDGYPLKKRGQGKRSDKIISSKKRHIIDKNKIIKSKKVNLGLENLINTQRRS